MELFQDVFDVLLDGARTTAEDLADLAIPFSFRDPFNHFGLAFSQRARISRGGPFRDGLC
jgi:hypothetical protein